MKITTHHTIQTEHHTCEVEVDSRVHLGSSSTRHHDGDLEEVEVLEVRVDGQRARGIICDLIIDEITHDAIEAEALGQARHRMTVAIAEGRLDRLQWGIR